MEDKNIIKITELLSEDYRKRSRNVTTILSGLDNVLLIEGHKYKLNKDVIINIIGKIVSAPFIIYDDEKNTKKDAEKQKKRKNKYKYDVQDGDVIIKKECYNEIIKVFDFIGISNHVEVIYQSCND